MNVKEKNGYRRNVLVRRGGGLLFARLLRVLEALDKLETVLCGLVECQQQTGLSGNRGGEWTGTHEFLGSSAGLTPSLASASLPPFSMTQWQRLKTSGSAGGGERRSKESISRSINKRESRLFFPNGGRGKQPARLTWTCRTIRAS